MTANDHPDEPIEQMAMILARAHIIACCECFPDHGGDENFFRQHPELTGTYGEYLRAIARQLLKEGVTLERRRATRAAQ